MSFVYIAADRPSGRLYIGSTTDLRRRMAEHKSGVFANAHTKKYQIDKLMWYEIYPDIRDARNREAQMKAWRRLWKKTQIEEHNPHWQDLTDSLDY